jgi:hypothetical protein
MVSIYWSEGPERGTQMTDDGKHEQFCFAGQPALCKGYFRNDVLPCVCGIEGDAVTALSLVAVPAPMGGSPTPGARAPAKPEPVEDQVGSKLHPS